MSDSVGVVAYLQTDCFLIFFFGTNDNENGIFAVQMNSVIFTKFNGDFYINI